ncbi:MAG: D-cysteine desulfhydrase family protein [Candidatus Latescibacteria bacterium]|nr:D-cysteine desulfhydrase family protein [Candidatus Latescibacterota bacterium]
MTPIDHIPRVKLTSLPTPIEPLSNLSRHLGGPKILVKRDDLTTLGMGGNKTRKLEFLVADALEQGADTLITTGGVQSNHCRLTAAAATRHGLHCELILGADSVPQGVSSGNLMLDQILGARLHFVPLAQRNQKMEEVAAELRKTGRTPYIVPLGGSNGLGAIGYANAMVELKGQLCHMDWLVDHIIFPTSSGGTQAGMQLGAHISGFQGHLTGISIDQTLDNGFPESLASIANDAAGILGLEWVATPGQFALNADYLGGGYGVMGDLEREAIVLAARTEGLFVDPVYSARALGGMIHMIDQGTLPAGETILFWHTGGTPALFAYADALDA